jgi:hypothetical protein
MAKTLSFTKRALITKANSIIVFSAAAAAFVVVFSLVAGKALISQGTYQNKIISKKEKALSQLKSDLSARNSLVNSYRAFVDTPQNVLGGAPGGKGDKDGDNARIVLDALPSKYDFPALATSVEKLVLSQGLQINGITGTDQEITESVNQQSSSPKSIAMPFDVQVVGSYNSIQNLVNVFERSIRPFQMKSIDLTGDQSSMSMSAKLQTYYQPEKSLKIKSEVVK